MLLDPAREEDRPVELLLVRHEVERNVRARRLRPRDLVDALGQQRDMRLLPLDPASLDYAAVDAVVHRVIVLAVPLVLPAVVIGVDEMRPDKILQRPKCFSIDKSPPIHRAQRPRAALCNYIVRRTTAIVKGDSYADALFVKLVTGQIELVVPADAAAADVRLHGQSFLRLSSV